MKLTYLQEELLKCIHRTVIDDGKEYFYCEVGDCKPWDNRTVSSLKHRGIIKLVKGGDMYTQTGGIYFITLGSYYFKEIREKKLKEILD